MKRFKREGGFSLVELMVVILIIGILVAIAIPVYNVATTNAERRTCQANLRTLTGACETFRSVTGAYPATLSELHPDYVRGAGELTCPGGAATGDFYNYTLTAGPSAVFTIKCPNDGTLTNHKI